MISAEKIPNNVGLSSDKRLMRALEHWQPAYLDWWREMGPPGFQDSHQVYLRTAVSVDAAGWAHFDYVKMPDYRWGIFLTPVDGERTVNFGDHKGQTTWQEVLGNGVATAATALFTNNLPPADLRSLVPKIAPRRALFVYGERGQSVEEPANRAFYTDAREPKAIWEVPQAGHVGGLEARPKEYESRVVGFFDGALLRADEGGDR